MHRTNHIFYPIVLTALIFWTSTKIDAQYVQQGNKLVGSDTVGGAQQGWGVSISSDGNTALVGGYGDNGLAGAAWVYARNEGVWSQQGSKLVGTGASGAAQQGRCVSLSSDGNTAIVGGYADNNYTGAAWVYTRSGGLWSQQGGKLVGTDGTYGIYGILQGISVGLSSDGNTAIVGGYADNNYVGAAWVYTRSGGVWTQQGNKLVGTGASGDAHQGTSVALSADGNTAIIGAYADSSNIGAAWVFTRSGGLWNQEGTKLVGTGTSGAGSFQGHSVSLSSDGNTAIVGGPANNFLEGAAWVFTRNGGVWSQQGSKLVAADALGAETNQGYCVSLSSDGNTAVVGGLGDNFGVGAAWTYTRNGGLWSQQGKLVGTGTVGNSSQGSSVSISSEGNTIIVGGESDNNFVGAAWVFQTATVVSFAVTPDWNLISVPVTVTDYRKTSVFPSTTSFAYAFDNDAGYVRRDTLKSGHGYWLKFDSSETLDVFGFPRSEDTVYVNNGWNIIGSISYPVIADSIIEIPAGIAMSSYYRYSGAYTPADTLKPGMGYWVKVKQNGKLVFR